MNGKPAFSGLFAFLLLEISLQVNLQVILQFNYLTLSNSTSNANAALLGIGAPH